MFADRAAASGLDFVHFNGMTGEMYFPEMTGQGGALVDYDGDGDLDAYLVQGALLGPEDTMASALFPPADGRPPVDRLYRNDSAADPQRGVALRFVDVTAASGIHAPGYGMGVAVGDYDGDGFPDLYVTNYGSNQLFRNRGDGTFSDVTTTAGADDPRWSTSAGFFDYDADGRLDLYIVNYVDFDVVRNPRCFATSSRRDYCGPQGFPPLPDRLLRNLGGGRFEEVTFQALAGYEPGPGLGVISGEFGGDEGIDIFVANDGAANQLWIQERGGRFVEEGLLAGVALNREGRAEASMGVTAGDFDLDGDDDLFMTHLMAETNTLYVNQGGGVFEDRTVEAGLAGVSLPYTAFGTGWIDYDNDGRLDLVALNGAVRILEEQAAAGDPYPLKQPNQLFRNTDGRFEDVSHRAGEPFALLEVSRGAAFGDVDNDGDVDLLQTNSNGPARLLVNQVGHRTAWVGLSGVAPAGGAVLGARFAVRRGDGVALRLRAQTDGSYCSSSDPRRIAGLGETGAISEVAVEWPHGERQRYLAPPSRVYLVAFAPRATGTAR